MHVTTMPAEGVGFRSKRGPVLIALMLSTGLVAIDATVVATAVPAIVHDIGGFTSFPWLFSAYLLAQAVSVPVYAKLSDTIGRKPIMLIGIGLFLLGSILCGVAWSMPVLIAFRVVQGLGAGAVQPMAITIAGDIYTLAERAKVQGYLASVWAVSSVVGPTLGGVFASLGIWRGIFLVNIPLCLVAGWMLVRSFHENIEPVKHRVDYLGAGLLTVSLTLLILGALEGGQAWAWDSAISDAVFAGGALLFVAFILVERRAAEPVLPPWVVSRRLLATTAMVAFGVGAVMLGITSYVPTFLVGALSTSPIVAGLALAALTIGWPISASQSGRLYLRIGFRSTALIGITVTVIGTAVLAVTASVPNVALVAVSCFIVGLGLGLVATPHPDRRPDERRMERARRGHGHQPFRPIHRQLHRRRRFRCDSERCLRRHPARRHGSPHHRGGLIRRVPGRHDRRRPHRHRRSRHARHQTRHTGPSRRARVIQHRMTAAPLSLFGVVLGRSSPDAEGGDEIFVQFEPDAVEGVAVCGGEPRRLRGCVFHCQLEAFRVSAEPRQHSGQADFQIAQGRQCLGEGLQCWLVDPIVGLTSLGEPAELEFAAGGHDSCVQRCKLRVHGGDCCLAAHAVQLLGKEPFVFSPAGHGQGPAPVSPE
ncbi:hypothetical protein NicSoilC12_01090 [Arthrobacter sp. NicSoilC12]|nr:hypothetical protein NicSoilC12_01090 [Arthrobacter sp. NicSoilC12]